MASAMLNTETPELKAKAFYGFRVCPTGEWTQTHMRADPGPGRRLPPFPPGSVRTKLPITRNSGGNTCSKILGGGVVASVQSLGATESNRCLNLS